MKLTTESKLLLGIFGVTAVIIAIAAVFMSRTPEVPVIPKDQLIAPTSYRRGNASASAYLVEFSDFQCPGCLAAKPFVDEIVNTYKDKLLFVYRYFPLDQHPYGQKSAEAAAAAGAQGKFWEMYDLLFQGQDKLSDEYVIEAAKTLKLDVDKFTSELKNGTYRQTVLDDRSAGELFGVNATPTFYLNGKKLNITSYTDLKVEVEKAITQ